MARPKKKGLGFLGDVLSAEKELEIQAREKLSKVDGDWLIKWLEEQGVHILNVDHAISEIIARRMNEVDEIVELWDNRKVNEIDAVPNPMPVEQEIETVDIEESEPKPVSVKLFEKVNYKSNLYNFLKRTELQDADKETLMTIFEQFKNYNILESRNNSILSDSEGAKRNYRLPSAMFAEFKELGEELDVGIIRLLRATLHTAFYCIEHDIPLLFDKNVNYIEQETLPSLFGTPVVKLKGYPQISTILSNELIKKVNIYATKNKIRPSDLVIPSVENILTLLRYFKTNPSQ